MDGYRMWRRSGVMLTAFATLGAMVLSGCSTAPLPKVEQASEAKIDTSASYKIAPGDTVHIVVYNEADLTGDFLVLPEGNIQLPIVGVVPVAGLSADQLAQSLTEKLDGKILVQPRVSVNLAQLRSVYVAGAVNRPGAYAFAPGLTVQMAVAMAGGYTDRGARRRVLVQRFGGNERQFALDPATPIMVLPGDVLTVPDREF